MSKIGENQQKAWLSLLIPAFEHPIGVLRILDRLAASKSFGVECLIGDDSRSDDVENLLKKHPLFISGLVKYRRNDPALGAVPNWNDLLTRASGEYILLMHHDECPERDDFFLLLKQRLAIADTRDVLFLSCLLPAMNGKRLRHHVPVWLRRVAMRLGPEFLLLHNTLGSPSVVVARRSICVNFDPRLKWLVDVEWIIRLLRQPGVRWEFDHKLAVISLPHGASITAKLGNEIPKFRKSEAQLIRKHFGPSTVFNLLLPDTNGKRLLSLVERVLWKFLRALTLTFGSLTGRPKPRWLTGDS